MSIAINVFILIFFILIISFFALKGAWYYRKVDKQISRENEFYTELILGLESAGRNVCSPKAIKREIRVTIWELYNNLRVQPDQQSRIVALQRKELQKKQTLFLNLEEARVNLEVLPFWGIIGTLCGFAVPYVFQVAKIEKSVLDASGFGFFLAASSTICALICLIFLKKNYEAKILARFDYFSSQERALEKIMVECDGFRIFESWMHKWPVDAIGKNGLNPAPTEIFEIPRKVDDFID